MRILGVDPSVAHMGLAVVDVRKGAVPQVLHAETIRTSPAAEDGERLGILAAAVGAATRDWECDAVGVEHIFVGAARGGALVLLALAAGAACGAASAAGRPVYLVARAAACKALAGESKLTKTQTQYLVGRVANADGVRLTQDQADAVAVALATANRHRAAETLARGRR